MNPKFCAKCGTPLSENTNFCPACGWETSSIAEAGPQQTSKPPQQPSMHSQQDTAQGAIKPPPMEAGSQEHSQSQSQQVHQPPPPLPAAAKPSSKKGLLIGIIAGVSVLFIAALAVGGFFIIRTLRRDASAQKIAEAARQYEYDLAASAQEDDRLSQEQQQATEEVIDTVPDTLDESGQDQAEETTSDIILETDLKASRYAPLPGKKYSFDFVLNPKKEDESLEKIELYTGKIDKVFADGDMISCTIEYWDGEWHGIINHYIESIDGVRMFSEGFGDMEGLVVAESITWLPDDYYPGMQFEGGNDFTYEVTEIGRFISLSNLDFDDCIVMERRDATSNIVWTDYYAPGHGVIYSEYVWDDDRMVIELKKIEDVSLEEVNQRILMNIEDSK